jgi:starch phosphorylase
VRDYTKQLYAPAAKVSRALNADYNGARELAAWKAKVRANWPAVRVEHVESGGIGDAPEVGAVISVRAFVSLGELSPDDVAVQVLHGKINADDELIDTTVDELQVAESYEGGRHRFDGDITLATSGAFGYTVRVVPRNGLLISSAELGVVALA